MTEEQVQYVLNSERYIEAVKKMMAIYPNGFDIKKIAVMKNGNIVPKAEYGNTIICDEDSLEVVSFVGGG